MRSPVDKLWSEGVGVTEYSNTDFEFSRSTSMGVSDPDDEYCRLAESYRRTSDLESLSEVGDRALRVEIAWLIDNYEVSFDRGDYDIRYMIPPVGWLGEHTFEEVELVDESEVESDELQVAYSTTAVVKEMADAVLDEKRHQTLTKLTWSGTERILGRK